MGRWSCPPLLPTDRIERVREGPARLPPAVQQPDQPGGFLLAVWDLGQDPDREQLGCPGWLVEHLPKAGEEDQEKGEGLEGFGLADRGAREVKSPRVEWWCGASTPVYKSFYGRE